MIMGRCFMLCHYKLKMCKAMTHLLYFPSVVLASQISVVPIYYVIIYIQMKAEKNKNKTFSFPIRFCTEYS